MARKVSHLDVQRARGEWWEYHYQNRETMKVISPEKLKLYQYACSMIERPVMTIFGSANFDTIKKQVYELAGKYCLEPMLINPWYVSDIGWNSFLDLWKELPEPFNLYTAPCVQVGELYTLSTTDEIERPSKRV